MSVNRGQLLADRRLIVSFSDNLVQNKQEMNKKLSGKSNHSASKGSLTAWGTYVMMGEEISTIL